MSKNIEKRILHPDSLYHQSKKDKVVYGERWNNLWQRLGAEGNSNKVFEDLFNRYSEINRFYHNFSHIKTCLNEFDLVKDKIEDPDALELAIWFHDVIYKPNIPEFAKNKFDDEGASADFARDIIKEMKLPPDLADRVTSLITAIKRDNETLTKDEQYIIDIDTAIFGRSTRLFNIYEQQINAEFSWVPVEMYRRERARILSSFKPNPPKKLTVFRTEEFINRYEEQARYNLERTIIDIRN